MSLSFRQHAKSINCGLIHFLDETLEENYSMDSKTWKVLEKYGYGDDKGELLSKDEFAKKLLGLNDELGDVEFFSGEYRRLFEELSYSDHPFTYSTTKELYDYGFRTMRTLVSAFVHNIIPLTGDNGDLLDGETKEVLVEIFFNKNSSFYHQLSDKEKEVLGEHYLTKLDNVKEKEKFVNSLVGVKDYIEEIEKRLIAELPLDDPVHEKFLKEKKYFMRDYENLKGDSLTDRPIIDMYKLGFNNIFKSIDKILKGKLDPIMDFTKMVEGV